LPSLAVPPDLRHGHRVRDHLNPHPVRITNGLVDVAVVSVDRDQGPGVEH
jgi:hypothetical protein